MPGPNGATWCPPTRLVNTAFGFGAGFWVGPNVTLRGEGEWFTIGDYGTVGLFSVNVSYTF